MKQIIKEDLKKTLNNQSSFSASALGLSANKIHRHVLSIIKTLQKAKFQAYIVGGGVRDLLVGHHPKDFDIATNAQPEQIKRLFKNCRLIGRRFRLAHIYFGKEIIEVATFRAAPSTAEEHATHLHADTGMILSDNVYGNLEEDAWRRDFTVNALFYDPIHEEIIDYTQGLKDLQARILHLIGDPQARYREDPVRMLRAIRLATKLDFEIEENSKQTIHELKDLLKHIPAARLFEEFRKLFLGGKALATYHALIKFNVFQLLFPRVNQRMQENSLHRTLIELALHNTDQRIKEDKPVTPAFLLAAFLWPDYLTELSLLEAEDMPLRLKQHYAARQTIKAQIQHISIPQRLSSMMEDIWMLQPQLEKVSQKNVYKIFENRRFRAAYDFLLLRAEAGETGVEPNAQWWTTFQLLNEDERETFISQLPATQKPKRRRRRKKRDNKT